MGEKLNKFKDKWGITTTWDVIAILLVFAINGSFAAWITSPVTAFLGLHKETVNPWIYWPARILLITIIYQITIPLVGWCFGKYSTFREFTRKFVSRIFGIKL